MQKIKALAKHWNPFAPLVSLPESCSDFPPFLSLQLHGDDWVLASQAGAPALLLRSGVTHLRHLLQLQRGALRPAQHHLREHRQDEPLPLPPRLLLLHHHHRFLLFVLLVRPLHLHVPANPIPPLLPRGARLLHLREENEGGKKSKEESSEVMKD